MERMQGRTARWAGGAVLICLVIVAATWFGLISPRRGEVADLQAQNVAAVSANDVLRTRIEQLRVQYAKLPDIKAQLAEIRAQLPPTVDMSALVRAVSVLADSTGVVLTSIAPSAAEVVDAGGSTGASSGKSGDGLIAVPMSIIVTGDYFQAVAFLRQLQTSLPRAFLVTNLDIEKVGGTGAAGAAGSDTGTGGGSGADSGSDSDLDTVQVTIGGQIFSLLDSAEAAKAAAASAQASPSISPGASPGATGAAGGSSSGSPATDPPAAAMPPTPTIAPSSAPAVAAASATAHPGGPQW